MYCKAIRAAVPALQGTSRLLRLKWLKNTSVSLLTAGSQGCAVDWSQEYIALLPCNTTNITEIQTDFEESLELTLQEKTWPLDTRGQFLLLSTAMHQHQRVKFSTQSRKHL